MQGALFALNRALNVIRIPLRGPFAPHITRSSSKCYYSARQSVDGNLKVP